MSVTDPQSCSYSLANVMMDNRIEKEAQQLKIEDSQQLEHNSATTALSSPEQSPTNNINSTTTVAPTSPIDKLAIETAYKNNQVNQVNYQANGEQTPSVSSGTLINIKV